jgi:hypothetical protein
MIILTSQIAVWKNGIQHQMTLYCVVIVAGEQMLILRSFVHPMKSTIVKIAYQRLTCAKDRRTTVNPCQMEDCR